MIIDRVENIGCYSKLGASFAAAARFLQSIPLEDIEPGHYDIDGENAYANVIEREITEHTDVWEAHNRYADIHLILEGHEQIGFYPRSRLDEELRFAENSDCAVAEGLKGMLIPLQKGEFVIALPQDVHMPNYPSAEGSYSKKMVLKIKMD